MQRQKYVVDSGAMIRKFYSNAFTVEEALKEIEGRTPLFVPEVKEPSRRAVEDVIKAAEATGDLSKLSKVDIKLIALALELNAVLVTDDFAMQNVAEYLGIKWQPVELKGIKELRKWVFVCKACGRAFDEYPGDGCPYCGGEIKRKAIRRYSL